VAAILEKIGIVKDIFRGPPTHLGPDYR